jgi:hypothetical protein
MFCNYKNILGEPNKGIHSYRIFNLAIVDILLTIIVAFIFSLLFSIRFWIMLIVFFLLGIFFHKIFCVKTTVDKLLFPFS